ncbi:F-box/kelch-repeat protein At3g06240-like [Lotus japonicus]|uniref:F-box/kelch-repeat protein At3g06240-like n=1 Tax=Lotus japonicus TaxID=34305 RepID=UPI002586B37C|nr:F-box/kelch-repeat protein At3g06240-like [Lotus japonicus]
MSPPIPLPTGKYPYRTFGFGYDALNDTYKVVFYGKNHSDEGMHVYRMGESSWRSMQSFPDLARESLWQVRRRDQNGVYLNGTLNWIFPLNTEIVEMVIVSIDLATEELSQMSLPFFDHCTELILGTLKDSLCVLHNNHHTRFVIWQMKEFGTHQSWTKLFNFDFKENRNNMRASFEPVGFVLSGNHEILLTSNYRHVLYNKRDNTFRFTSDGVDKCHESVQNYVESLVSPR